MICKSCHDQPARETGYCVTCDAHPDYSPVTPTPDGASCASCGQPATVSTGPTWHLCDTCHTASTAYDRAIEYARETGRQAGKAAASWFDIPDARTARAILAGIEDGDPAILDTLPYADLSGEWADSLTGPQLVEDALSDAGLPPTGGDAPDGLFADICDAYEQAFQEAAEDAITAAARAILNPEGCARAGKLPARITRPQ